MADERKIVIEIKNTGTSSTSGVATNKEAENNGKDVAKVVNTLMHPIKTIEKETIGRNVLVNQAWQQAKQQVKQIGDYHIYKYFTLQENYLAETDYNNIMTGISKVSSFGTSIAAGAIAGAAFGPLGVAVGAGLGAAGSTISAIINAEKTRTQEQIKMNESNYQTGFSQTRLGLINGRGVTNQ